MNAVPILLCALCLAAEPVPEKEVCVTELWEVYDYDYDYPDEGGSYAELTVWAWNVEIKSELPNGMIGWTYVGYIQLARILHYDDENEEQSGWWCSGRKSGYTDTAEEALEALMQASGHGGDFKTVWK